MALKKTAEQKKEDHSKKDDEMIRKAREIAEQIQEDVKGVSEEDIIRDLPTGPRPDVAHEKHTEPHEISHHMQDEIRETEGEKGEEAHQEPISTETPDLTPRYDETLAEVKADEKEEPKNSNQLPPIEKVEDKTSVTPAEKEHPYKPDMAFNSLFSGKDPDSNKKKMILLFVIVALITVLVSTGGFYYASKHPDKIKIPTVSLSKPTSMPTPLPTVAPTPTPVAVSSYSVDVLNGSGTAGEAGKVSDLLKGAGFNSIKTGNADSYDYTSTEVQLSAKVPDAVYDAISKALGSNYVVTKSTKPLSTGSTYDVVITVGSSRK